MQQSGARFTGQATAILDIQGHVRKASPSLAEAFGDLDGHLISEFVADDSVTPWVHCMDGARAGERRSSLVQWHGPRGDFWAEVTITPSDGELILTLAPPWNT